MASFERSPQTPDKIPKEFIDYYGPLALYRSLKLKLPQPPPFDRANVDAVMSRQKFTHYDALIQTLGRFKNEIERLYAIFYHAAYNMTFDEEMAKDGISSRGMPIDIFNSGKAVCSGYCRLFQDLLNRTKISNITIEEFNCNAKKDDWYWNHPATPEVYNASLLITINNEKYICDPT